MKEEKKMLNLATIIVKLNANLTLSDKEIDYINDYIFSDESEEAERELLCEVMQKVYFG